MLAGSHCCETSFSICFSLILSGLLRNNYCGQGQGHSGDQQAVRKRLRKHENRWGLAETWTSFPQIPFETTDRSQATWSHVQPCCRQQAWNISSVSKFHPPLSLVWWVPQGSSSRQAAVVRRVFQGRPITHARRYVEKLSYLFLMLCWVPQIISRSLTLLPHIVHLQKKASWKVSEKPTWTTGSMWLMADLWNFGALRKVSVLKWLSWRRAMPADFRELLRKL